VTKEAYITGVGIVSPVGVGKKAFLESVRGGRCGLDRLRGLDATQFRIGRGGEVPDSALDQQECDLDSDRCFAFALQACREALADAGLDGDGSIAGATLALGSGAGEMRATEITMGAPEAALLLDHPRPLRPPNGITSRVAGHLGLRGRLITFVNACAAGAQAIAVAADLIRAGRAELAVAGGVEVISRMVLSGFEALRAVSPTGSHPFDADRDGIQLSEMAAFVVLESAERLAASRRPSGRAVVPYARLAGSGASADATHVVRPAEEGTGAALALERALEDAGLPATSIDYVNAHGTGTVQNDPPELAALVRVFGERAEKLPISSTKAMLGHALGASGAAEAVICSLAMRDGFLPPTIGWRQPIAGYEKFDFVPNVAREGVRLHHIASSSFAFGGNNVVLILSSPDQAPREQA
jgi:3-oxoacyl-(acyl-carrier-protein) synthase